ncbi:hypothetical protein ACV354_35760, partial [Pseudomonas aeruginosa]
LNAALQLAGMSFQGQQHRALEAGIADGALNEACAA